MSGYSGNRIASLPTALVNCQTIYPKLSCYSQISYPLLFKEVYVA